ncbi:glucoamylase family protein [Marivirga sp.]|uniref:glucoamylase family protein n=1 Tax=Marivirga sp. TaxID=2018662 RepID=UPI003DA709AF
MRYSYIFYVLTLFFSACQEVENIEGQFELNKIFIGNEEYTWGSENPLKIPVDQIITLVFSQEIDESSVDEGLLLTKINEGVVNISINVNGNSVSIFPSGSLTYSSEYEIEITEKLKSSSGADAIRQNINFFTQLEKLGIHELNIDGRVINLNNLILQNVQVDTDIRIEFSAAIDQEKFEEAISIGNEDLVFEYNETNTIVDFRPQQELSYLKKYQINLENGDIGALGENFDGFSKTFFTRLDSTYKFDEISDEALLTKIQAQTFQYFWDFAHPNSGLARERNTSGDLVTIGGSGFGLMAIIVGIERGFITRQEGIDRFEKIVNFLSDADRFHGVWPHWMNGNTGNTIPFSELDDGADLVETAFMIQGLLAVRQYLDESNAQELAIINQITTLWEGVEWDWFTKGGEDVLYWHWSPENEWAMNLPIRGWNESLIIYVLAASSPTHPIEKSVYDAGWARNGGIINGSSVYEINMPLGETLGGPLFFAHYSFLGLDPRNLQDQYANYWEQNQAHSLVNQAHCTINPNNFIGYSEACWGLTASDNHQGYSAHSPGNDLGVITPTAAISSIPYTPEESMKAIRHFYYLLGDRLWGEYGFYDAFNVTQDWYADSYLAIDQGPIITMIENHRTALIWDIFMQDPDVQKGLNDLGFTF